MMKNTTLLFSILIALVGLTYSCSVPVNRPAAGNVDPRLSALQLPEGFQIEVYADNVKNARSLCLGDNGTLFVATRSEGKVYALLDTNNDQKADKMYTLAEGLQMPNGVAFRNGSLYVAEVSKVWRYDNIESKLEAPPEPVLVSDAFPSDTHHGWKYIAFGPDDKLYVPVGAPCNICEKEDTIYSTIMRMNPDGSNLEVYAAGVRNSVGFDWHPEDNSLYFTENGRDWLGNDMPPDELNHAPAPQMHFGYPYCHGGVIPDPKFGTKKPCGTFTAPLQNLGPHVAALGICIYNGDMFPDSYKHKAIIAEHGSWNRDEPIGYRLTIVDLAEAKAGRENYNVFASGWLGEEDAWGRPVDVLEMPDGALLVSDDVAGMIYRVSYQK